MRILLVKPGPELKTVLSLRDLILLEPLELGYLAAAVPKKDEVKILDLRLSDDQDRDFGECLSSFRPELVGISGYTHEASIVKHLARIAKTTDKNIKIVTGGHHATVMPEDYNIPEIDIIVKGEGSRPFRKIIENITEPELIEKIPGVLLSGDRFDRKKAAAIAEYPDMSEIPEPRRDLWDPGKYTCIWPTEEHPAYESIFPPVALLRTSYGCPMNCSFCVVPKLSGRKHRTRNIKRLVDEVEKLKQKHVYFCDDESFVNTKYMTETAEEIKRRGIKKKYFAWARSTTVNKQPELFRLWKSIGLDTVFLGIEFVSDEQLKATSKKSSVEANRKAHAFLRENGIAVIAGFMLMPEFSHPDFDRLEKFIESMEPAQLNITVCTPSPGSEDWYRQKDSFICDPYKLHDCMHPLTKTKLPLKEFYARFAELIRLGAKKNPLSSSSNKVPLLDIGRIAGITKSYSGCVENAYMDFPRELWKNK